MSLKERAKTRKAARTAVYLEGASLAERFGVPLAAIRKRVTEGYGVAVVRALIQADYLGDLNGAEIRIGSWLDAEDSLFMLLHLFGHTVQWNTQGIQEFDLPVGKVPEATKAAVTDYEREACRYSMGLLLETGFADLGPWLSDFSAADLRYLHHVYETGERRRAGAEDFWRVGEPLVAPLAIPSFTPKALKWRWDGVVV
jgi:hypothetical protein